MSATLQLDNFGDQNVYEVSQLEADSAVDDTDFTIENPQNFAANNYLFLGRRGSEGAELFSISSLASNVITASSGALRAHSRFDEALHLFGNKIKLYRAPNVDGNQPSDDDFTAVTSGTIDIDTDQLYTEYVDADGSSDYWYKYTYYNPVNDVETPLEDSSSERGGSIGIYASLFEIREEAGISNNRYISNSRVNDARKAAQEEVHSKLSGIYTLPFETPVNSMINRIVKLLAAGFLLTSTYGVVNALSTNNGDNKTKEARDLLQKLSTKELVLNDVTGTDTSLPGTGRSFGGWPDASTAGTDTTRGGAERNIRMGQIF